MSLVKPLGLAIISSVISKEAPGRCSAYTAIYNLVKAINLYTDPPVSFVSLVGQLAGVETDLLGAGDHLAEVDICIRRIKETIPSIQSKLPWDMPDVLISRSCQLC